jgi:hypothetical protein
VLDRERPSAGFFEDRRHVGLAGALARERHDCVLGRRLVERPHGGRRDVAERAIKDTSASPNP